MEIQKNNKYTLLDTIYILSFFIYLVAIYTNSQSVIIYEIFFYFNTIIYLIKNYYKITISPYFYYQLIFIVVSIITMVVTVDYSDSFIELQKLLRIFLIGNSLITFIDSREKLITFYKLLVISGISLLVLLLAKIPPAEWFTRRLGGSEFGYNANEVGISLAISVILSTYLYNIKKEKIYPIIAVILSIAVLLTGSRKSLLLIFAGIAGVMYLNSSEVLKKARMVMIIFGILAIGYYSIMNIPFLYEITGIRVQALIESIFAGGEGDGSTIVRQLMIRKGIELFKKKPLLGNGLGSFANLAGFGTYAHNNYIELLANTGVLGFFSYYLSYIYILCKLIKYRKKSEIIPFLTLIGMLILLEMGAVTYNEIIFQIIIIMAFASVKVAKLKKTN